MPLRKCFELVIRNMSSPDIGLNQCQPFFSFCSCLWGCCSKLDWWYCIFRPVKTFGIAFRSKPPNAIDLIAAHHPFCFAKMPSMLLNKLVDIHCGNGDGLCEFP